MIQELNYKHKHGVNAQLKKSSKICSEIKNKNKNCYITISEILDERIKAETETETRSAWAAEAFTKGKLAVFLSS